MDETEKYKQRLEAIAEKRRLQEEQDRARRDMEDEKLRLQQLKRKSLRDQWLMEGAPLSPMSLDTQSPCSPLWGSQAQEIENRIDKLQSESQRLAEEEKKLEKLKEGGQTQEAVKAAEAGGEVVQYAVVQNGESNATASETTEDEVKTNQSVLPVEAATVLTNGGGDLGDLGVDVRDNTQSTANGPVVASEGVIDMRSEPGLSLGVSEAEPAQVPYININEEEEEEGTLVMRAECVIITDEGDDVPEDPSLQEDPQETMQSEEVPPLNPEAGQEGEIAVEDVVKTKAAPETSTQTEKSEATESTEEAQPATGDGEAQGDVKTNEDEETKAEEQDRQSEDPTSVQVRYPASALEGTAVASLPVYSEAQPSTHTPELEAEGEAATLPEGTEAALKPKDPALVPGHFQDVPLADPQENQRTEERPGEREPLLSPPKAPDAQAEPAVAAGTETLSPARASQGEETAAPKHKTCQCCSVM